MIALAETLVAGLATGSVYVAVALAFSLLWQTTAIINFAVGDVLMIAAFVAITAHHVWHLPLALAMVVALVAVGVLGVVIQQLVFKPLSRVALWFSVIATLGLSVIFQTIARLVWGPAPVAFPEYVPSAPIHVGPLRLSWQDIATIVSLLVIVLLIELFLQKTGLGRTIRAVAQDRDAAQLSGIRIGSRAAIATALSFVVAGAAGILLAPSTFVSFNMGIPVSLAGFAAAIVGGFGSIRGALVGGLTLGVLNQVFIMYVSSVYATALLYSVAVVMIVIRPRGLVGDVGF